MTITVVRKLRDIDPAAKAWLVRLLGPDSAGFPDDAEVRFELRSPAEPAVPPQAAAVLADIMARMEDRLRQVPEDEMEAALDEAMGAVRPTYRR